MSSILLPIREFIINNFCVSIKSLQINKTIINKSVFLYLLKLIPFFILKRALDCINIKYIYLMDNIYFSNYSKEVKITPVFISLYGYQSNELENNELLSEEKVNLLDAFKKYSSSIPLWFFLENEKLNNINTIQMKYFSKGKMNTKDISIEMYKDRMMSEMF
jgi:hypothetical protein